MNEEVVDKVPNLNCAQWLFELLLPNEIVQNKESIKQNLFDAIKTDSESTSKVQQYSNICNRHGIILCSCV